MRAVLRGFFQLNDGKMSSPGQLDDVQVKVFGASPTPGSWGFGVGCSGPRKVDLSREPEIELEIIHRKLL